MISTQIGNLSIIKNRSKTLFSTQKLNNKENKTIVRKLFRKHVIFDNDYELYIKAIENYDYAIQINTNFIKPFYNRANTFLKLKK